MSYYRNVYLKSDHWQNLRLERLAKSDARCAICGTRSLNNDVHHLTYRGSLYEVDKDDLRVLCRRCHREIHRLIDENPQLKKIDYVIRWRAAYGAVKRKVMDERRAAAFRRSDWGKILCAAWHRGYQFEISMVYQWFLKFQKVVNQRHQIATIARHMRQHYAGQNNNDPSWVAALEVAA